MHFPIATRRRLSSLRRVAVKLSAPEAFLLFVFLVSCSFLVTGAAAVTIHALTVNRGDFLGSAGVLTRALGGDRVEAPEWWWWRGFWGGLVGLGAGSGWVMIMHPLGHGCFLGAAVIDFEENGMAMRLRNHLMFRDAQGRLWSAPRGTVSRGGCLPPGVWNLLGPPFLGLHREASIIHEHYCQQRAGHPEEVHQMFYEACRASGVPDPLAKAALRELRSHGADWSDPSEAGVARAAKGASHGNPCLTP